MCVCLQAEDGIRYLVRPRGLGDVYKRQTYRGDVTLADFAAAAKGSGDDLLRWKSLFLGGVDFALAPLKVEVGQVALACLLYTSDAADERSSVDLGGRRLIKQKKQEKK